MALDRDLVVDELVAVHHHSHLLRMRQDTSLRNDCIDHYLQQSRNPYQRMELDRESVVK